MTSEAISELNGAITMEIEAVQVYTEYLNVASQLGDTKTAELFKHIIEEEKKHQAEFEARLTELMEGPDIFSVPTSGPAPIDDIFSSR